MSFVSRLFKQNVSSSTKVISENLLAKWLNKPIIRKQYIDGNQLQRLSLTLNRPDIYSNVTAQIEEPIQGTPIPPGHHLVYFTPVALPDELGNDGTDKDFSPDKPFLRRMWAGGEMRWDKTNRLAVGNHATETSKLVSAAPKITRTGEEMIVVGVEKTFENEKGVALVDRRDWVFRPELTGPVPVTEAQLKESRRSYTLPTPRSAGVKQRDFSQTAVSLFRFSALTFNGHQIHYSRPWCRDIEGQREMLVHGPLNLINMLDFWRDSRSNGEYEVPKSIRYRASAPIYVGEVYRALLERGDAGAVHVKLWCNDGQEEGRVGMIGDILPHGGSLEPAVNP